jgi:hypothetical protein
VVFFLACAWADAGEQSRLATPSSSKPRVISEEPKYLIFWSPPEKAGELVKRVGMKGNGKTRLLGFGLPLSTYEKEDGVPARPLGYRALLDRGFSADNPPDDFHKALAKIVQETIAFWCQQFVDAGIPAEKLYPHVAAPAPAEAMNAPIWTAFNKYSRPGWTTYAVGVLGENFSAIYEELQKHGNPAWAGVEANAGVPGSVVDWETYLAWHYNHGCVLVGVNMGATGKDLPRRLSDSALGEEAIAGYHKFLTGQPLVEKAFSMDHPQFRIQVKMKRVRAGVERWHRSGKDPSAVAKVMEGAQPLASSGKLDELEKLVDQALEMLGETEKVPDVYPKH